jgi:hypothetical protein
MTEKVLYARCQRCGYPVLPDSDRGKNLLNN